MESKKACLVLSRLIEDGARANMAANGTVSPVIFALKHDGGIGILPAPFGNDEEKNAVSLLMRKLAASKSIAAVALVSEAWAYKQLDDYAKKDEGKRIEVVIISIMAGDIEGFIQMPIDRSGDKPTLGERSEVINMDGESVILGRFCKNDAEAPEGEPLH